MTAKPKVLVVDDEPQIRRLLRTGLPPHGYEVSEAATASEALKLLPREKPDALILDLGLPDEDGFAIIAKVRAMALTPILVLSARNDVEGKVRALELGADDYVTKPFSIRELLARVKAVLRRSQTLPKEQERYSFGDIEVNLRSYQVFRNGKQVEFSSKEFELLKHFLCHSGETLSRDRLLDEVWGYENFPTTRTVDAHIVRIRQKLEPVPDQPRFFLTVHGVGYKFVG